jgi:hypothetical protein
MTMKAKVFVLAKFEEATCLEAAIQKVNEEPVGTM